MHVRYLDILALIGGLMLPLAFAPFYLSPIGYLSPAILLFTWLNAGPVKAFQRGLYFGMGCFAIGISWVYISIHVYGQADISVSLLITAIFIVYLAFYFAAQGYFLNKMFPENNLFKLLFAFPSSWVIFEALRGWMFTGFPWLLLGYSQTNTWLGGYASLIGVYGISFICTVISGFIIYCIQNRNAIGRFAIPMLCVLFAGGFTLQKIQWTSPIGATLKVTLIQGNIQQEVKWQPDQILKSLQLYIEHTYNHFNSDIVIWPEAAITLPLNQMQGFLNDLSKVAQENKTAVLTGIPIVEPDKAFNSLIVLGSGKGIYHKRHLVPFGEYIPLEPIYSSVLKAFNIPMSNSKHGDSNQATLTAKEVPIAPYICYEVAYPIEFLSFLPTAQLLVTVTDDSWFGHSIAAEQHLQMAQMRAMETGRFLLFSSNTGITAIINHKGSIVKSLPPFEEAELTAEVQPMQGATPWVLGKTYPLISFMVIGFLIRKLFYKPFQLNFDLRRRT